MTQAPNSQASAENNIIALLHQTIHCIQHGQIAQARKLAEHILTLSPEHPDGWHLLGLVARRENHYKDAIDHIQRAISYKGDEATFHLNLGNVFRDSNQLDKAELSYARALELNDKDGMTYLALGTMHYQAGGFDNARICFERAAELAPENYDVWYNLAATCNVLGKKKEKLAAVKKALAINPNHATAWHLLAQSQSKHDAATITRMESMWEESQDSMTVDDGVSLCFGLGKIYEDKKDHDTAFMWYSKGNRLKRQSYTYDIYQSESKYTLTRKLYDREWLKQYQHSGVDDSTPVFVVGLPRSGTSLVEQILASHSQIHGAGELLTVPRLITTCEQAVGARYPLIAHQLSTQTYKNFAQSYLAESRANAGDARFVVDKLPGNYLYLGMIHAALPKAKIIHCVRDGMDNAVSIFRNLFGAYTPYAYDLWEIGRMQVMHNEIMQHWKDVLPKGTILEVSYESIVQDFESNAHRMLDFIGVEWEDACMEFHRTKRSVNTASSDQVRQPLYDSSVGASRHYSRHLQPLEAAWSVE
jgi:tetratricopeptide (TPR) repeat protein